MDDDTEAYIHVNEGLASRFLQSAFVEIVPHNGELSNSLLVASEVSPRTVVTIHCDCGVRERLEAIFGPTNPLVTTLAQQVSPDASHVQLSPARHPSYGSSVGWYKLLKGIIVFICVIS